LVAIRGDSFLVEAVPEEAGSRRQATAQDRRPRLGECREQVAMFSATVEAGLECCGAQAL